MFWKRKEGCVARTVRNEDSKEATMNQPTKQRLAKRRMSPFLSPAFFVAIIFSTSPLQAIPITVPTDLNLGDQYRLAFVTSTTRDAGSSSISNYNTFVSGVASGVPELAALGTTWRVIGSTATVDARDNTGTNPSSTGVPIYRLDDTRIANNNADLWDGTLLAPLGTQENGSVVAVAVFTGTYSDGTAGGGYLCPGATGINYGYSSNIDSRWIHAGGVIWNTPRYFYALSGELTVVPEPTTVALLGLGALCLTRLKRRTHK